MLYSEEKKFQQEMIISDRVIKSTFAELNNFRNKRKYLTA